MNFLSIKKRIASNIGYVDSSGDILATKDITATDIGNWANDRYLDDLVATISTQYPEDYEVTARANFYKTSGTIATISSTTYVLTSADITFNNAMVGDRIYNSTEETYEEIDSYTSSSTVTMESAPTDWSAGDTIYVLGSEFALGGDATDARSIRWVGVKYDEDDEYYTVADERDFNKLFKSGGEKYSENHPIWYVTTTTISSVMTSTLGILPQAKQKVDNGIEIRYVQLPSAMSSDGDVPRLPLGSHSLLVMGGTADALRKMLKFEEADVWENRYQVGKLEMVANYAITRTHRPVKTHPSRKLRRMTRREL